MWHSELFLKDKTPFFLIFAIQHFVIQVRANLVSLDPIHFKIQFIAMQLKVNKSEHIARVSFYMALSGL